MNVNTGEDISNTCDQCFDMHIKDDLQMHGYYDNPPNFLNNLDGVRHNSCFLENHDCVALKNINSKSELFIEYRCAFWKNYIQ